MKPTIIDSHELRANPALLTELRENPGAHVERRTVPAEITLRAEGDDGFVIEGHAAVFDDLSVNLGGFREKIDRGAFRKVLKDKPDVRALFNHDPNLVLARSTAGTLDLKEDTTGLVYRADVAPTSYAADLRVLMDRGEVTQSSFAFRVADDSWDEDDEGRLVRTIREFSELFDVSPVTYPAYPTTDAAPRTSPEPSEQAPSADTEEREAQADEAHVGEEQDDASGGKRQLAAMERRRRLRLRGRLLAS